MNFFLVQKKRGLKTYKIFTFTSQNFENCEKSHQHWYSFLTLNWFSWAGTFSKCLATSKASFPRPTFCMLQMIATTTPLGLVVSDVVSFLSQGKINKTLEAPTAPPVKKK